MMNSNKQYAIEFLTLASRGEVDRAFERYVGSEFQHHNPWFQSDARSLAEGMLSGARSHPDKEFEILRVVAEGPLVFTHSRVRLKPEMPIMAVVHIFRFEGGKIVELWDVGQATPDNATNPVAMF